MLVKLTFEDESEKRNRNTYKSIREVYNPLYTKNIQTKNGTKQYDI